MVALYITPVITGAIFYLINNYSTNPKEDQNIKRSISQSLPETELNATMLTYLLYPFIGVLLSTFIVNLWGAQDDAYKSKKELYINLQKAYRIKTQDVTFTSFEESNWSFFEKWTYYKTLRIAAILNFIYETFFYRFETIDKTIELLKDCIENEKFSRYIK